jgi:hypothetical protein
VSVPAFRNLFTLEESLKYFSGLREPLHKNYYIYSSRYVSVFSISNNLIIIVNALLSRE